MIYASRSERLLKTAYGPSSYLITYVIELARDGQDLEGVAHKGWRERYPPCIPKVIRTVDVCITRSLPVAIRSNIIFLDYILKMSVPIKIRTRDQDDSVSV